LITFGMRKPIRMNRKTRGGRSGRWWAVAAAAVLCACAFLLRHDLPTVLTWIDGGPARIAATSLEDRIQRTASKARDARPQSPEDTERHQATARFPEPEPSGDSRRDVTVAAWMFNAPDLLVATEPEKAWRTSFGAERVARDRRKTAAGFEADVVAVLGVSTFATLRTALPARDYFLISPPQMQKMALAQARSDKPFPFPAVAIALRRQAGLRAGRRVQTMFGDRSFGGEIDAALRRTPSDLQAATATETLPFALEVIAGGSRFWVVAAHFSESIDHRIGAWVAKRRADGDAVLLVGVGRASGAVKAAGDPEFRFGGRRGQRIANRDTGCSVPDVSIAAWRAKADEVLLARLDTLWRTRPAGGDCVLMARLPVNPRPPRPVAPADPLFPDAEAARTPSADHDPFGIAERPDPVARPEPIQLD
jgi:hypothetical protein